MVTRGDRAPISRAPRRPGWELRDQGRGQPAPDRVGWLEVIVIWAVAFAIAGLVARGIAG